jgi:glycosyltransferase involved in cell wall biosynthesis
MRFCMVTTFYPPYHFGGDATYVRALSRSLAAQGHEVEVIHCLNAYFLHGSSPDSPISGLDDNITVHRLNSRFGMLSPLISQQTGHPGIKTHELKKLLDKNFDVVNFHNISLMGGPAVLKFSHAPVTLYTLHEHWLICPTHIFWKNKSRACETPQCIQCSLRSGIPPQLWRYTSLVRKSLKHADRLLSPSSYTAKRHQNAGIDAPIEILPLYSSLDSGNKNSPTTGSRPRFLFVGRVTESKGIINLLKLFSELPQYDLQVVGKGDLLEKLQRVYLHHTNIQFLNEISQEKLVSIYQNATALLFPSLAPETFGLAIIEAFACGTPAIVRDAGASRELIDLTGAGFVYDTEEKLKQFIIDLANDINLRNKLGQLGRISYENHFTPAKHLDHYLKIIRAIQSTKNIKTH